MKNGNRSGFLDGTEKGATKETSLECDVGLGLRMQRTESFPSSTTRTMPLLPSSHHHRHHDSSCESMGVVGDGGDGGGPFHCTLSNQVACFSDIYDVFGPDSVSDNTFVWPRTSQPSIYDSSSKTPGGNMAAASAKVTFTESQWQEFERQTTIYKYMMASLPVPPQLLISLSKPPSPLPSASQSNSFSRNSDPEPWRCRRTDGKKWRCSRDVTPNQKYCERHAHKNKPRSRKPVELPSHNTHTTTNCSNNNTNTTNNNLNHHPLFNLPANPTAQKPIFDVPTMVSGPTYAQPRCTEWLMKRDSIPESTLNQQWQLMQSFSREGLKRCNQESYRNLSIFQQHYDEQQESMNTNSYIDMDGGRSLRNQQPKIACLQGCLNTGQNQTTRRFIDAWSSGESEKVDALSNKYSVSSKGKLPLSSLTLSMSGDNGVDEQSGNAAQLGLGIMDPESESGGGGLKPQWLESVSWMGSPPGGPLGEALCLGIASNTTKDQAYYVPSPHRYSNSTSTSSCSKTSREDGDHGMHFY